jgi:hypothetical protein
VTELLLLALPSRSDEESRFFLSYSRIKSPRSSVTRSRRPKGKTGSKGHAKERCEKGKRDAINQPIADIAMSSPIKRRSAMKSKFQSLSKMKNTHVNLRKGGFRPPSESASFCRKSGVVDPLWRANASSSAKEGGNDIFRSSRETTKFPIVSTAPTRPRTPHTFQEHHGIAKRATCLD